MTVRDHNIEEFWLLIFLELIITIS